MRSSLLASFHGYTIFSDGTIAGLQGKQLKPWKTKSRSGKIYLKVALNINRKRKVFFLHRLVAEVLIGPTLGYEVNHKNRITTDCKVSNLEIITASENQQHWRKNG
jgi:hypothetical protein